MSYTQFQISDLQTQQDADTLHVSVKVKNSGARAGAEVAQLYIGFPDSEIDRPVKLLQAFSKVFLQPGEERVVNFKVPVSSLAYFNPQTQTWLVAKGAYKAIVGNSSGTEQQLNHFLM